MSCMTMGTLLHTYSLLICICVYQSKNNITVPTLIPTVPVCYPWGE